MAVLRSFLYWARTCCTRIGAAAAQRPLKGYLSADSHQPLGRQASRRLLVQHVLAPYILRSFRCLTPRTPCRAATTRRAAQPSLVPATDLPVGMIHQGRVTYGPDVVWRGQPSTRQNPSTWKNKMAAPCPRASLQASIPAAYTSTSVTPFPLCMYSARTHATPTRLPLADVPPRRSRSSAP